MQKRTCPNGHVYDPNIYGDTCPLCPTPAAAPTEPTNMTIAAPTETPGAHTRVVARPTVDAMPMQNDPTGKTQVAQGIRQQPQQQPSSSHTVIRRAPSSMGPAPRPGDNGRKLVGFLVTYNRTPMGKAFNIYEGRNYVGRDADCDVAVPDDQQMSGRHMLIRYLSGNNKFSFKDEMSSNGTYVNKQLLDEGELQNYDIIRVGSTLFIFIAIPQV